MRFPPIMPYMLLALFCACHSNGNKESSQPKQKQQLDDAEFQKIRKQQDSILELRQKKSKKKGLDSLKPIQV